MTGTYVSSHLDWPHQMSLLPRGVCVIDLSGAVPGARGAGGGTPPSARVVFWGV